MQLGRNHKYRKVGWGGEGKDDGEKEEHFFKVAGKLLRRGRGNILGLSVERQSPAGCAPGFEVLCRFSPVHEPPPTPIRLALSNHPSLLQPHFKGRGRDVGTANCARGEPKCGYRRRAWRGDTCPARHKSADINLSGWRRPERVCVWGGLDINHVSRVTFSIQRGQDAAHRHMYSIADGEGNVMSECAEPLTFSRVITVTRFSSESAC